MIHAKRCASVSGGSYAAGADACANTVVCSKPAVFPCDPGNGQNIQRTAGNSGHGHNFSEGDHDIFINPGVTQRRLHISGTKGEPPVQSCRSLQHIQNPNASGWSMWNCLRPSLPCIAALVALLSLTALFLAAHKPDATGTAASELGLWRLHTNTPPGTTAAAARSSAAVFLYAVLGAPAASAAAGGSTDTDDPTDAISVELLAVREGLYVGEVKLKITESALMEFRRRGDLAQAGDGLAEWHRAILKGMRGLAEEIHVLDEQTADVTLVVQSRARDALSALFRATQAIQPELDSREKVFGHLRDAAAVSEQAADEVSQLALRYAQLAKKAHDLQSDSVEWLIAAKGRGGRIQHEADRLKALIDKAEKIDPGVLAPAPPAPSPALKALGPPPQPTWMGWATGSNRIRHESYWRRYNDEQEMYERHARAREEYRRYIVEAKMLDAVNAHLDDGTALMAGVGDVLDDVMAVLHQVRDHYRHRAKAYRDAVRDLEVLCGRDDASQWATLAAAGFGEEVAGAVRVALTRADRSFDSFVGFQSAAHAKRSAVKKELHLQLRRRP